MAIRADERDQAFNSFLNALELDPVHVGTLKRLGLHYTSKGDIEQARKYLEPLAEISSDNWKAHNGLGVVADLERDFTRAREHYTQALKLRPDLAILWNNHSYSLYLVGDYPTVKTYMNRALELDPGLESARSNLALVFVRETDYEKALATIRKTKDIGTAYTTVGYLAYRVGEFAWAEELLEQAIGRSPTYNKPAHDYLAATRRALAQEVPSERPDQEVKSRIDAYAKLLNGGYSSWEASRLVSRAYGVAQSETLEALEKYSAYLSEVLSSPRPLPNS